MSESGKNKHHHFCVVNLINEAVLLRYSSTPLS